KIQQLIEDCQGDLKQFNAQLDQEKKKYDEKESQLLKDKEKIETISQQIKEIIESSSKDLSQQVQYYWQQYYYQDLKAKIQEQSQTWESNHNPVWEQRQIINDYGQQFNQSLLNEIKNWSDKTGEIILNELGKTYTKIEEKLKEIEVLISSNYEFKTTLVQPNISTDNIEDGFWGPKGILGGGAVGGAAVGAAFVTKILAAIAAGGVVAIGLVPAILLVGGLGTIVAALGLGMLDIDGNKYQIKEEVINQGLKQLDQSQEEIKRQLSEAIDSIISNEQDNINKYLDDKKQNIQSRLKDYQESNQKKLKIINNSKDFINEQTIKLEGIQAKLDSMENNQVKQLISSNQV
ncbi:MAG: hypothetical protein ACKPH7_33730, partial [Planktothrix sp.]|uniref:hypothetical protein n=2 Tax=Planktothrix sp. TaxID=3088171 RepID=UPI0038D45066